MVLYIFWYFSWYMKWISTLRIKSIGFDFRTLVQLSSAALTVVWPWAVHLTFLSLSFFLTKMGIIVSVSLDFWGGTRWRSTAMARPSSEPSTQIPIKFRGWKRVQDILFLLLLYFSPLNNPFPVNVDREKRGFDKLKWVSVSLFKQEILYCACLMFRCSSCDTWSFWVWSLLVQSHRSCCDILSYILGTLST